jgi:acyl-CoA thioesterase-1
MRTSGLIVAGLLLTGCQGQAQAPRPAPTATASAAAPAPQGPVRRILAFGDSLFAGYRLGRNQGYPERLQAALRARGINAQVTNAGVSGDTTADGRQRFQFVLGSQIPGPELVIVELGGNDLLRGLPPAETRANLKAILEQLRQHRVKIVLMGMRAPPNMGPEFQRAFDAIYPDLAKEYGATLVPFFQATIYDKSSLLQADHVHPTAPGVDALVAATVEQVAGALPKSG